MPTPGPKGDHGWMLVEDWRRVIDQATELGSEMVRFIGGEPTSHPDLPALIDHARDRGVEVEVLSEIDSAVS